MASAISGSIGLKYNLLIEPQQVLNAITGRVDAPTGMYPQDLINRLGGPLSLWAHGKQYYFDFNIYEITNFWEAYWVVKNTMGHCVSLIICTMNTGGLHSMPTKSIASDWGIMVYHNYGTDSQSGYFAIFESGSGFQSLYVVNPYVREVKQIDNNDVMISVPPPSPTCEWKNGIGQHLWNKELI